MAPKLGLWDPYSTHRWNYLQWACEENADAKPVTIFEKVTKVQNIALLWVQNGPNIGSFETHVVHIYESSSNELIKQDWCESRGNVLTK